MASTRVTLKHPGMAALLKSSGVRAFVTSRAQAVESAAKSSAPVDTGAYRDSIHIEQDTTDRAVVRVVAGTDHAFVVEANYGVLARALDAAR